METKRYKINLSRPEGDVSTSMQIELIEGSKEMLDWAFGDKSADWDKKLSGKTGEEASRIIDEVMKFVFQKREEGYLIVKDCEFGTYGKTIGLLAKVQLFLIQFSARTLTISEAYDDN